MSLPTSAVQAHRATVEETIADIVRFLQDVLGTQLVAYMTDVEGAKTVSRWAAGTQAPRIEAEKRLRTAYQVFQLLQTHDSSYTVRAWMIGMNPQLGDMSPAEAIRDGNLRDVWLAAKAFIAGG